MPPTRNTVHWSVDIRHADNGDPIRQLDPDRPLRTASLAKVLLLIEVARQAAEGSIDLTEQLTRTAEDRVADSGLWQHLGVDSLSVGDLGELVGSVSDNLATNVLLRRIGLDAVARTAGALGLVHTALHDRVRDQRTVTDPPTLSTGTAAEWTGIMADLHRGAVVDPTTSAQVLQFLAHGTDLSQVAAPWGLDPLAHHEPDRGLTLHHKTGTDTDVRAETGLLTGPAATIAYTVIANFPAETDCRDEVLAGQQEYGRIIARAARGEDGGGASR